MGSFWYAVFAYEMANIAAKQCANCGYWLEPVLLEKIPCFLAKMREIGSFWYAVFTFKIADISAKQCANCGYRLGAACQPLAKHAGRGCRPGPPPEAVC